MAEIILLPHNEEGYEKLTNSLEDNQMVSINHATGTGKSFILLKYISKNLDKRILYLAPTYPILEQLIEDHSKELGMEKPSNVDTMIYRSLLSMDMNDLASKYDVIILDEYHRCGAKKWGKKVNELLDEIRKNYSECKVIGTTATEIRYLDNEKNMNEILFNGLEASRLELSDAILRGILPAPVYVTINYGLLDELNVLEKRVVRLVVNEKRKKQMLETIISLKHEMENLLNVKELSDYLRPPGKYLVFSANIGSISEDRKKISKLFNNEDIINYEVHSGQSREKNKTILKEFRDKGKDVSSILYSVDILNEGVHVKGVDSIFMLRPTMSPIIYFQQLGRLLSYSSRKDEVVVFDLVSNIKNHPLIYQLYADMLEKAKELIKKDPENKERYENILKRFRIIDKSSHLYTKVDELNKKCTVNNLCEQNIIDAIDVLQSDDINSTEKLQANIVLFKFQQYITVDLFKKINLLKNIEKPNIFNLTISQFKDYLGEYSCVKEKNSKKIEKIFLECKDFNEQNESLPSILSDNIEEVSLANKIFQKFDLFSSNEKKYICNNITNDLSLFEKISYGYKLDEVNFDLLVSELDLIFKNDIYINDNVSELIRNRLVYNKIVNGQIKYGIKDVDEVYTKLTKSMLTKIYNHNKRFELKNVLTDELDIIFENNNQNTADEKVDQIYFQEQFNKTTNECIEELNLKGPDKVLEELYEQLKEFISEYKREPKYHSVKKYHKISDERRLFLLYENKLFYKKIILKNDLERKGYLQRLDDIYLNVITNHSDKVYMDEVGLIINFMESHNGEMPSLQNADLNEVKLAKMLRNHRKDFSPAINNLLETEISKYNDRRNQVFNEYINFIKKNRRKPIILDDDYEIELVCSFNRCYPYFDKQQLILLKQTLSSVTKKEQFKNIYEALKSSKEGSIKK